jgi:hypothetical protein
MSRLKIEDSHIFPHYRCHGYTEIIMTKPKSFCPEKETT